MTRQSSTFQPTFTIGALTDVGRRRKHNEDSILVREDLGLYIVADGMGGHQAGDFASQLAVTSIAEFFERTEAGWEPPPMPESYGDLDEEGFRLVVAIWEANRAIFESAQRSPERKGMGTTIVAARLTPDGTIRIAHAGDSRCYRISNGELEQITQDHSFVNDVRWSQPDVDEAIITNLPKNVITRALGTKPSVEVDARSELVLPGDSYLLCSDGLSGMVTSEDIRSVVDEMVDPQEACEELVRRANANGGKDNISVIIIHVDEVEDTLVDERNVMLEQLNPNLRFDEERQVWCCARCGHEYVEGTRFCVECGANLIDDDE